MPHILRNQLLEVQVDLPGEAYRGSRFDWTGTISAVRFQGRSVTGAELASPGENPTAGKGFYNEFGIDTALGFDDTELGDWFHKIGIGLLKKDGEAYQFHHPYDIRAAAFEFFPASDQIRLICRAPIHNGYAYQLEKVIEIQEHGFALHYLLKNLGEKAIVTTEYCHNFLCLDEAAPGPGYELSFPFLLKPERSILKVWSTWLRKR